MIWSLIHTGHFIILTLMTHCLRRIVQSYDTNRYKKQLKIFFLLLFRWFFFTNVFCLPTNQNYEISLFLYFIIVHTFRPDVQPWWPVIQYYWVGKNLTNSVSQWWYLCSLSHTYIGLYAYEWMYQCLFYLWLLIKLID